MRYHVLKIASGGGDTNDRRITMQLCLSQHLSAPIKTPQRKKGRNHNKKGSVRNINGKIYVDFMYLGERVREKAGLTWNESNEKLVRKQLDRIIVKIEDGTFRFAEVFPNSKKKDYFTEKERSLFNRKPLPNEVKIGEYIWKWYELAKGTGERTGRTLLGYRSYLVNYLDPFFGEMTFADLNAVVLKQYVSWSRKKRYRGKTISNKTVHKTLVPLKMICTEAAIEYGWGNTYNPFFGFKVTNKKSKYKIKPFSKEEQERLIKELDDHWKPYFRFAFCAGLRPGEQIAIKPENIDWEKRILHIQQAITLDESGKIIEGPTKNESSQRSIKLLPVMYDALKDQRKIYEQLNCKYFFCSKEGKRIDLARLRQRVWLPALERAKLSVREMKQTRHSFATNALSCGENPLWIAKTMGHVDTKMLFEVYAKYIEKADNNDGMIFNSSQTKNNE